jgi:hypothetical protein
MANPGEGVAAGTKSVLRSTKTGKRLEGYGKKFSVAKIHEAFQSKHRAGVAASKKARAGMVQTKSVGTGVFPNKKKGAPAGRSLNKFKKK